MKDEHARAIATHHFHRYDTPGSVPPVEVIASGSSRWFGAHGFGRASTGFWGLELVTAGDGVFIQDGKEHRLTPGTVFILRRGSANRYRVGPSGFLHKRYLQLRGMAVDHLMRTCGIAHADTIILAQPGRATGLFRAVHGLMARKPAGWEQRASAAAYELLMLIGAATRAPFPDAVRKIVEHVDRTMDAPLAARDLAAFCGISVTHCSRLANQHLGCSPKEYIIGRKMALASHLLRESAAPVKEIALKCGYEDPLYFSAQFRKQMGKSPKEYHYRPILT